MPPRAGGFTPRWPDRRISSEIDYRLVFPGDSIESIYTDKQLAPDDVRLLKRLVYDNGGTWQLSNYQLLISQIPTA